MKFKILILNLFILSLLFINIINCKKIIKSRIYCSEDCQGSYKELEIEVNRCKQFPPDQTCNFNVPYFTAIPNPNENNNYTVITSFKCDHTTTIQDQKKNVELNQCGTFTAYGVTFSIFPNYPTDENSDSPNTSNHLNVNSIVLFSALIFSILLFN